MRTVTERYLRGEINTRKLKRRKGLNIVDEEILEELGIKTKNRKVPMGSTGASSTAGNVRTLFFMRMPKFEAALDDIETMRIITFNSAFKGVS